MNILWYISSHGWGHAARQRELIRIFKNKYPDTHITVASNVPGWFWNGSAIDSLTAGVPSPVVIEKNGDIDIAATRLHFLEFLDNRSSILKSEKSKLSDLRPDIIVSDIDPLPFKASEAHSIPAFGISNFTWDWIMKEMFPDLEECAAQISEMYSSGTYLRLPMSPEYSPFKNTIDVPLLRGGPPGNKSRVKNLLPEGKVCLVALREMPPGAILEVPEGFTAVSCLPKPIHQKCLNITPEILEANEAVFADLVDAADVVVTKPGYGIVSQILAMGKRAVLFTGRQFPEERCLLAPLKNRPATVLLGKDETGSTGNAILKAWNCFPPAPVDSTGGTVLLEYLTH